MNNKNQKLFKDTFDKISISEHSLTTLKNINGNQKRKQTYQLRYATVFAMLIVFIISGSVISYAITNTVSSENTIYFNGKKIDEKLINKYTDSDGKTIYEVDMPGLYGINGSLDLSKHSDYGINFFCGSYIEKKAEKTYLIIRELDIIYKEIDITDDIADGTASGYFNIKEFEYYYCVQGETVTIINE